MSNTSLTKSSVPSKGVSAYTGGPKSPTNTPEENAKNLGGIPATKTITEINAANDPSKRGPAPGVARGV